MAPFRQTFDSLVEPPHNSKVAVRHLISCRRGFVSGIVVAAFAVAMFADCVSAAQATNEQMACCAAMGKACGPQSQSHSCCTNEAPRVDQSAGVHRVTVAVPRVAVSVIAIEPPRVAMLMRMTDPARDRHGSHPPGVPPYLLDSLLRI